MQEQSANKNLLLHTVSDDTTTKYGHGQSFQGARNIFSLAIFNHFSHKQVFAVSI